MQRSLFVATAVLAHLLVIASLCCSHECAVPDPPSTAVNLLYDDDCDGDIDCVITQPIIHHWIDTGYIKMWGMVSSAPSSLGAPAMEVFRHYYNHDSLYSIGAWTPNCAQRNSAAWDIAMVAQFDPGDVCTNYANCVNVLRTAVANYASSGATGKGLVYVITGPLTCEEAFRASPADSISPLSGADMERKYISSFVMDNGYAPSGIESNCAEDAPACASFFANVNSGNGYPPVFVLPVNTGATRIATPVPAASLPQTNPSAYAWLSTGAPEKTFDEDALTVEYAVFGGTGWNLSADRSNIVNLTTGGNSWSVQASGQYYLTLTNGPQCFGNVLDVQWLPAASAASVSPLSRPGCTLDDAPTRFLSRAATITRSLRNRLSFITSGSFSETGLKLTR